MPAPVSQASSSESDMRSFIRAVSAVSRLLGVIGALLLLAAIFAVSHMVFVRYVLVQSTVWQTEYPAYAIFVARVPVLKG